MIADSRDGKGKGDDCQGARLKVGSGPVASLTDQVQAKLDPFFFPDIRGPLNRALPSTEPSSSRASVSLNENASLAQPNPISRETLGRIYNWAQSIGGVLSIGRISTGLLESLIPLGAFYLGAKLVPLAIEVNRTGEGLASFNLCFGALIAVGVAQVVIRGGRNILDTRLNAKLNRNLHEELLYNGISLSQKQLEDPLIQNRITKLRENVGRLHESVTSVFGILNDSATMLVTTIALVPLAPPIAGALLLAGVWKSMQAITGGKESSKVEDLKAEPRRRMWYTSWPLRDPLGLAALKSTLRAHWLASKNIEEMKALDDTDIYLQDRSTIRSSMSGVVTGLAATGAVGYGLYSYIAGSMSLEVGILLGTTAGLFAQRMSSLSQSISSFLTSSFFVAEACALRKASERSKPTEFEPPAAEITRWDIAPSVKFHNVSVRVPKPNGGGGTKSILEGINFEIRSGECIAIVGPTGAGKTTLVKALLGGCDIADGEVLIDESDRESIPLADRRANTSYLPQMFWVFSGYSVAENIAIGNPVWEPEAGIQGAARDSGLADIMTKNGFNFSTLVGPEFRNGRLFSGGENQLIALATALAKQGKLIVLDEPTSRLDTDTAEKVLDHIRKLSGATRIVITHDMGLAKQCQRIIVMSKANGGDEESPGSVEAVGTHAELLMSSPTYRNFFETQKRRFEEELSEVRQALGEV